MSQMANAITKRERDCLVFIEEYTGKGFPIRLHEIASTMKVKSPTAFNVIKRLEEKGLAESRNGMVKLTTAGKEAARKILIVHRTFESLFCQSGIPVEKACEEASDIDFLIPENNARKVLKRIDNPKVCPHGKPIWGR